MQHFRKAKVVFRARAQYDQGLFQVHVVSL